MDTSLFGKGRSRVFYMELSVQEPRDFRKIRLENLDRLRIEVDGGEALEAGPDEPEAEAAAAAEEIEESVGRTHKTYPLRDFDSLGFPEHPRKRIRPLEDAADPPRGLPVFRLPLFPAPGSLALMGVRLSEGVGQAREEAAANRSAPSISSGHYASHPVFAQESLGHKPLIFHRQSSLSLPPVPGRITGILKDRLAWTEDSSVE
jgi:hypothetical protein